MRIEAIIAKLRSNSGDAGPAVDQRQVEIEPDYQRRHASQSTER